MTLRVTVKPELLRWACERGGHDAEAYASQFRALPAWLTGEQAPTLKQLESFAKATRTPIGFFFLPKPPLEQLPLPDFRTRERPVTRPTPNLLDTIYVCQQRQEWYRDYARSIGRQALPFVGSARLGDDVVSTATKIRAALGFDLQARAHMSTWTEALRCFIEQADDVGILVMCSGVVLNNNNRPLDPDEFRGFAIADTLAPLVFVNGADTKAAQMFTLAHELAHVWLGTSALSDDEPVTNIQPSSPRSRQLATSPIEATERWCNHVAAETLVPLEALRTEYRPDAALRAEVDRLARRFKVSTLVILRRIHDAGGLTPDELREEYGRERARLLALATSSGGGNFYLTQAARVSKRFARSLIVSTLEGQTLHRDALRMLGFSKLSTFHELGRTLGVIG